MTMSTGGGDGGMGGISAGSIGGGSAESESDANLSMGASFQKPENREKF